MIFVYVTFSNSKEAKKITTHLLKKRLIACANMFPIQSIYWWKGKIANDREVAAILKTSKKNLKKVESETKKLHSYDTPCIISWSVYPNFEYKKWLINELF